MVDCSRLFDNDLPDGSVSSDILSILLAISSVFNFKKIPYFCIWSLSI